MFEPAPFALRDFHLSALRNAYALMAGAAETGKPHACWAHHMSVGGARTADQLVALGYFTRRLDAKPGDVGTFRYRITAEGCAHLGQPYLVEDLSMSEETPVPVEPQPVDLSYPPKTPAPELKVIGPATPDGEWLHRSAADLLNGLTRDEALLLARIYAANAGLLVDYSPTRVSLTKKGLIVLAHRESLAASPIVELTPLGEAAAALQAEMRIAEDDAPEEEADDEPEERQRFTFKRGDRVHYNGAVGTVDATDIYPLVLFEADRDHKLVKVSEHDLERIEAAAVGSDDDSPHATQEIPAVELTADANEVAELRADRDNLIEQAIDLEAQVKALRTQLAAVKTALADEDGALPDDPAASIAALKLRIADQQRSVEGLSHAFDVLQQQFAVVEQERDVMKRDVTGLKLQIAHLANSGEMGVEHDWTHKTTPADITARTLAGWTPWHKEFTIDGLTVVWERKPNQKPARRDRTPSARATGYTNPPAPRPATPGVLQPDAVIIPVDMPADPAYRQPYAARDVVIPAQPDRDPEALNPMSAVMSSFTRNLHAQFEANPVPQYSVTPGAKQPDRPSS